MQAQRSASFSWRRENFQAMAFPPQLFCPDFHGNNGAACIFQGTQGCWLICHMHEPFIAPFKLRLAWDTPSLSFLQILGLVREFHSWEPQIYIDSDSWTVESREAPSPGYPSENFWQRHWCVKAACCRAGSHPKMCRQMLEPLVVAFVCKLWYK